MNDKVKNGPAIIIVEDELLTTDSILKWIEPAEYRIIGPINNKEDAISAIKREEELALGIIDLKILETSSGQREKREYGFEIAKYLDNEKIPVLIISHFVMPDILEESIIRKFSYFYKQDIIDQSILIQAIELILIDFSIYSKKVVSEAGRLLGGKKNDPLEDKEWIILCHRVNGLGFKEIADKENYAPQTIRTYIGKVYKKIGVSNAMEATRWFLENAKKYGREELLKKCSPNRTYT